MPTSIKRKSGAALLLSLWSAVFIVLSDAAYAGYLLKLRQYEWAAPAYQWLDLHIGYSFTNIGFFALYLSLPLAFAALLIGLSVLLQGGFWYKIVSMVSLTIASASVWYAGPSWFLTACGLVMLLASPHTHSIWDRAFALISLLLPLSAFILCKLVSRQPKPLPPADKTNDL